MKNAQRSQGVSHEDHLTIVTNEMCWKTYNVSIAIFSSLPS